MQSSKPLQIYKHRKDVPNPCIKLNDLGDVLTALEVSQILQVCDNTVCNWIKQGKIKGYRIPKDCGKYYVNKSDLIEYMQ